MEMGVSRVHGGRCAQCGQAVLQFQIDGDGVDESLTACLDCFRKAFEEMERLAQEVKPQ